ncbi:GNAT family N-acetyltransferase [Derxia gummosa]|uniref:GNAT family N-acetyltransferase n=1 Tax=Derxia gummosa DSM 723 TaxID=1121388 RepID=A0A8B6X708_9BURK|nr:GNAT family N-acetyltransferase [Derxia gummosa]
MRPPPDSIETARATLRRPRPGDADAAFRHWAGDPEVFRYLGNRAHETSEQTRQQLDWDQARWFKKTAFVWLIVPRGETENVGMIELQPDAHPNDHRARLGFALARARWGQGLMSEAAGEVLRVALEQCGLWRIDAVCDVENPGSARVMEKIGMQREGRLARYIVHPNAGRAPRDVLLYARHRDHPGG